MCFVSGLSGKAEGVSTEPKRARPPRRVPRVIEGGKEDYSRVQCRECKQPLIEIHNHGQRLSGCLTRPHRVLAMLGRGTMRETLAVRGRRFAAECLAASLALALGPRQAAPPLVPRLAAVLELCQAHTLARERQTRSIGLRTGTAWQDGFASGRRGGSFRGNSENASELN